MSRKWVELSLGIILFVFSVAGCARKPAPAPTPTPVPPTPTFTVVVLPFPTGKLTNMDYVLDFKSDGTYTASGPQGTETGTYVASGDQVVLTCQCCGNVKGTYSWIFDGSTLTFHAIDDACLNRLNVVSSGVWSQNP